MIKLPNFLLVAVLHLPCFENPVAKTSADHFAPAFLQNVACEATHQPLCAMLVSTSSNQMRFRTLNMKTTVRSKLLPLWTKPFLLDANAGALIFDASSLDFKFSGDLSVGYQWEQIGVLGRFAINAYDLKTDTQIADTTHPSGQIHGWFATTAGARWRFEGRLEVGLGQYDTTVIPIQGDDSGRVFSNEISLKIHGAFLGGARYSSTTHALGVWLGTGFEHETYENLTILHSAEVDQREITTDGAMQILRVRSQSTLIKDILDARVRIDLLRHGLTRTNLNLLFGDREGQETNTQLNVFVCGYLDLTALAFFGFVPTGSLGFDVVTLQQNGGTSTSTLPRIGIGLRQTVF